MNKQIEPRIAQHVNQFLHDVDFNQSITVGKACDYHKNRHSKMFKKLSYNVQVRFLS